MRDNHDFPSADDHDYAANPKKSQAVAARQRARRALGPSPDAPAVVRSYPLAAIGAGAVIVLLVGMMSYQLGSGARPLQLPPPTDAPARLLQTSSVASQEARAATPAPEPLPTHAATPTAVLLAAPVVAPIRHDEPAIQRADWTPPEVEIAPEIVPEGAPEPEPTAPIVWPTSAPATAADFAKPDIRQTCAFIGCVGGELAANLDRANQCHALYWQHEGAEDMPDPDYSLMRACVWEGLYR